MFKCLFFFFFFSLLIFPFSSDAQKTHTVFFEGTEHELHVYKIEGHQPGKTIMLIGGIQGDEPGGFLSADHYADLSLIKGKLIVVPRANFYSILLKKRKINEDMNRKFADDSSYNYEDKIVSILKKLISQSDCLLNLHDGSGFYSEKWISSERNPKRYGQSIIADCAKYKVSGTNKTIDLKKMAVSVLKEINKKISKKDYYFHFNNHKTRSKDSLHKEQRKSATYYALFTCNIPAFGIETSKSLPLELKVAYHNFAINAFMDIFGVIPETPGLNLELPKLNYMVVSVNDSLPIVVRDQQTLNISKNDFISVLHIESNYERGLSADIIGQGTVNDFRKKVKITKPTRVVARKDYYNCGSIYLSFSKNREQIIDDVSITNTSKGNSSFLLYKIKINGKERIAQNYEHIDLVKGDKFEIEDVISGIADPSSLEVNFKGYIGNKDINTGEDRGYVINTAKDLLKKYSINKKGEKYHIIVNYKKKIVGELFVDIKAPVFKYLMFKLKDKRIYCLKPGGSLDLIKFNISGEIFENSVELVEIISNIKPDLDVAAFISGASLKNYRMKKEKPILLPVLKKTKYKIEIKRDEILLGSVILDSTQELHCEKN